MQVVYPCPKCNTIKLSLLEDRKSLYIRCDACGFKTKSEPTENEAIQTWNKEYIDRTHNKKREFEILVSDLFNMFNISIDDIEHKYIFDKDKQRDLINFERNHKSLMLVPNDTRDLYGISTLSLLSTLSHILTGSHLKIKMTDCGSRVAGINFLDM